MQPKVPTVLTAAQRYSAKKHALLITDFSKKADDDLIT